MLTRREVLTGSVATAAMLLAPAPEVVAAVSAPPPPMPAWAVGSPGEMNWQHIVAATEHEARLGWCEDHVGDDTCEQGGEVGHEDCDCEVCIAYRDCEAERQAIWDGKEEIGDADWFAAGMGCHCSRCGYEAFADFGGRIVQEKAVCADCMTLDDWEIVDPEHAAELREERGDA